MFFQEHLIKLLAFFVKPEFVEASGFKPLSPLFSQILTTVIERFCVCHNVHRNDPSPKNFTFTRPFFKLYMAQKWKT